LVGDINKAIIACTVTFRCGLRVGKAYTASPLRIDTNLAVFKVHL
jgi:hypothetical protein